MEFMSTVWYPCEEKEYPLASKHKVELHDTLKLQEIGSKKPLRLGPQYGFKKSSLWRDTLIQ